ncbi:hypothetical protein D3C78_1300140 [compost metagenome]
MQTCGKLVDEEAAIGAGDVDTGNLATRQRFQRLANIERQLQRAGEEVHGAGRNDAERDAVLPGDGRCCGNRAVAAAGNDGFNARFIGGAFHFLDDIFSGDQTAIDRVASTGENVAGVFAIGFHVSGTKSAAVAIENCNELHVSNPIQ